MRILARYAFSIGAAAALLTACESQSPIGAPGTMPQPLALAARTSGANYNVVYSFGVPPDGNNPGAGLIDVGGTLYGTTTAGGVYSCNRSSGNPCGTVFSITTGGSEQVLHSFGDGSDGSLPTASLTNVAGTLYGTTSTGGLHHCPYSDYTTCGTVFTITTGGTENVLHSFDTYSHDGAEPEASLVDVKGTLYGTTAGGGAYHCGLVGMLCGTVFSITPGGTEKVLHSFGSRRDGAAPKAELLDVHGTLYGTTFYGGKRQLGTVFRISLSGSERVLHRFGKGADGSNPAAGLIKVGGLLYGTTTRGGAYGHGTVFSITREGAEKVLHSFGHGSDGRDPLGSLVQVNGTLYGTTQVGGTGDKCNTQGDGCGTVFSITPEGTEQVLHNFGKGTDGFYPEAALTDVDGTLYGTTWGGGTHRLGTVFALKP
ncbi:MAG: hypothetical protein JO190_07375 [Candidatus Eremiobacteraeota bacterium]|nr:hypothetical protein [Candidatus Eremiobacteraeota bacterium]